MKLFKKIFWVFSGSILIPLIASAQGQGQEFIRITPEFKNPLKAGSFKALVVNLMEIIIQIGVPIGVFFIIYAGFLLVTARGNEDKVKRGKQFLLWSVIGTAVLLGALVIASAIQGTVDKITN